MAERVQKGDDKHRRIPAVRASRAIFLLLPTLIAIAPRTVDAQTIYFNTSAPGQTKAITEWGADTAWPSPDNMRQSIAHMGVSQIDVIRVNFYLDEPLQANGEIGPNSKARLNTQLSIAAMAGSKPIALTPNSADPTDPWYLNGADQVRVDRWVQVLEATQEYINRPIAAIEPFNEPDYWDGQGTPQNLRDIMLALQSSPNFPGTQLHGASTLNSNNAQSWYDQISGPATHGTLHQLAGSTDSYVNFIQHVQAVGDEAYNPELHSLAEAIYGAEYGLQGGIWWGPVLRARGLFVNASQGQRLGYAENRARQTAAAVYRGTDGELRAFAGGFERDGGLTSYRLVSTDRDVYFNGVGPIREFMVQVDQGIDAFVDIDYDANIPPALDGNRWQIVNRQTGQILEVVSGGTTDGSSIRLADDIGALYQRWDVERDPDGYYSLSAAHSGRTAEVADWSLNDGAAVRQWGMGDNILQHWFIEQADPGYFYIRNGHSNKYMSLSGRTGVAQASVTGAFNQQWQFVLANPVPTGSLVAHYKFDGNAIDSAGANHATTSGGPAYSAGQHGQAIQLDGVNDFATLPAGVANSADITVAAWVRWNGGAAWQRIFDFGNGTGSYLFLTPRSADNTLRFAITTDSNNAEQILETDQLPTGQWVHLAVTLSGNTGILYVNGAPRVAGRILLDPADVSPAANYIGKSQWPDPLFNGLVDDFRIYDYALNQAQIAALFAPLPGDYNADGLVDAADYTIWRDKQGAPAGSLPNDVDGGIIGLAQYNTWKANFGNTAAAAAAVPVPEPTSLLLILLLFLLAFSAQLLLRLPFGPELMAEGRLSA